MSGHIGSNIMYTILPTIQWPMSKVEIEKHGEACKKSGMVPIRIKIILAEAQDMMDNHSKGQKLKLMVNIITTQPSRCIIEHRYVIMP